MAHIVVQQQIFVQLLLVKRAFWPGRLSVIAGWLRSRVRIESWARNVSAARPPSQAAAFVRVSFGGDYAFAGRAGTAAKSRAAEIEAAPKEMNGALLAHEPGAKFLEHQIR